jgi:hypothetical protein
MNVSAYNVFTGKPERKKGPGRFRSREMRTILKYI